MMVKRQTILAVDDTVANLDILVNLLQDFDVIEATCGEEALDIVAQEKVDLILLDIMMPGMDGYTVCRKIKESAQNQDIPIIFITSRSDDNAIGNAYDAGGVDYVTKPFKPKELQARVKIQLEHQEMIERLEFLASHDPMTGIYNRRKFFELANLIDKFKKINDTYGHPTGDRVIKAVTGAISELLDEDAVLGRLGGEEFAILCHHSDQDIVVSRLKFIRKKIENLEILSDRNLDELLQRADEMLYKAKGAGRNKTVFRI